MMTLDWTAIFLAALTALTTVIGWVLRQSFGRVERHMEQAEEFMREYRTAQAIVVTRVDGIERWLQSVEKRVELAGRVQDIEDVLRGIRDRGCGNARDDGAA